MCRGNGSVFLLAAYGHPNVFGTTPVAECFLEVS